MTRYAFPSLGAFRDRDDELRAMEDWFDAGAEWRVLAVHGRRRVGKSWLFRAFAHGREADIFVADTRALADQLAGFAAALERDGERPAIPDLESFFRLLYRRAAGEPRLAVIDELPFLWKAERNLPSILLRVMEEEAGRSRLKLLVAGSHVGMMERLLAEREPLHDRMRPLHVRPMDVWRAGLILGPMAPELLLTSYGLVGGMPRYLAELAGARDPVGRLFDLALNPHGALFNEPRAVLAQELDAPHVYFSLLAALGSGPQPWGMIVGRSHVESEKVSRYLATLESLGLVDVRSPVTDSERSGRNRLYALADGFLRFWFRFVLPFQADLESGLDRRVLASREIEPHLSSHLAPAIEDVARDWVRRRGLAGVSRVGAWWGPSEHALRRAGERTTEEIDIVGMTQGRVVLIGEVRWRSGPMDIGVLGDLDRFKLPALRQAARVASSPWIVLVSRGGFTDRLREAADGTEQITLVGPADLLA